MLAALPVVAAGAGLLWLSEQMVAPSRPRVSDSSRTTLGLSLRDGRSGLEVVRCADPARSAGIEEGDRIVRVDGEPARLLDAFESVVSDSEPGRSFTLEAIRPAPSGAARAVMVTVVADRRPVSPTDEGLPYEDVAFTNRNGLTIRGWYVPARSPAPRSTPAVVYGHGNAADRRQWLGAASWVHEAGLAQLLFDFTGRGESDGEVITLGWRESEDLLDALAWLRSRPEIDPTRCALAGKSMGAAAAILAASQEDSRVAAVVADSAFSDLARLVDLTLANRFIPPKPVRPLLFALAGWRADYDPGSVRPIDAIGRVRAPILLLHGDRDVVVPIGDARELERAADGRATLAVLEGLGHNDARPDATFASVARFLDNALR